MSSSPPEGPDGPRILVSGWAGAGNIGDELLTRAVIARLRDLGAVPVVASQDPPGTRALHGVDSVPWGPRGIRATRRVDGVCIGPGGILQDSSSLWSLPGHLTPALIAGRRGVPVASVGVGAEPLRRESSGRLLRRALGGCTVVTRDEASSEALRQAGLSPVTGADLVFGLSVAGDAAAASGGTGGEIVVSIGGRVSPGVVTPASRRVVTPPLDEIAAAVDRLAGELDASVVLTRFRGRRDAEAGERLRQLLTTDAVVLPDDVGEHVRRVAAARLVVSSRYHPLVLAAMSGVPAIAVSDQPKVRALVEQLAMPSVVRVDSWTEAGTETKLESVPRDGVPPLVRAGIDRAHEALAALVEQAGASRAPRSRG